MSKEIINILWTGGWDSTFRVMELADKNVIIQPYYLMDDRKTEAIELNTIKELTQEILKLKTTNCTLNEVLKIKVADLEPDTSINSAFQRLSADFKASNYRQKLGSQYDWLARFSKNINNLELSVEKGTKPVNAIHTFGAFKQQKDSIRGKFSVLDKDNSSKDLITIFGNYHYPLLDVDKMKMHDIAQEKGFLHILNKTWFCHKPRNNKPCGKCNPCMETIEVGLKYRFGRLALLRYRLKKIKKALKK